MNQLQKLRYPYRKNSGIKSNTSRLSELVTEILKKQIEPRQDIFARVNRLWEQLLPVNLRKHCRIAEISGGRLKILADSPSYTHEIRLLSEKLVHEINRNCPKARITGITTAVG